MKRPRVRIRTLLILVALCAVTLGVVSQTQKARLREQQQRAELERSLAEITMYRATIAVQQAQYQNLKQQLQSLQVRAAQTGIREADESQVLGERTSEREGQAKPAQAEPSGGPP